MSIPRTTWPAWTDKLLHSKDRWAENYGQPKWWVRFAWPFIRTFWWDKGWGFGDPPWWTQDELDRALEQARLLRYRLGFDD